jgi:hypothetical protein
LILCLLFVSECRQRLTWNLHIRTVEFGVESQGLFANWILKKLMIMSIGVLNLYVEEVWLCQEVDEMDLVLRFYHFMFGVS